MTTYINLGCSELEQIPNYVFENTEVKILYLFSNILSNGHQAEQEPETPCTKTRVFLSGLNSLMR